MEEARGGRTEGRGKGRWWNEEERNVGRMKEGKRECELKGPRYASVGVGPDWTRVSTFLRCSEHEMQQHEGKRQREKADRVRGEWREGWDKRDIGEKGRESSPREVRSRPGWAGSVRTLKNLWPALRPTSKRCYSRVLGAGTVRFTQRWRRGRKSECERGRERRKGVKGDPRTRACTLTKRAIELVNVHPDNR